MVCKPILSSHILQVCIYNWLTVSDYGSWQLKLYSTTHSITVVHEIPTRWVYIHGRYIEGNQKFKHNCTQKNQSITTHATTMQVPNLIMGRQLRSVHGGFPNYTSSVSCYIAHSHLILLHCIRGADLHVDEFKHSGMMTTTKLHVYLCDNVNPHRA